MFLFLSPFTAKAESEMKHLSTFLMFLMTASVAYAQQQTVPSIPSAEESGTRGDMWLMLWIGLGFIVVIVGVYMFIRQSGGKNL